MARNFVLITETIWANTVSQKVSLHGYTLKAGAWRPGFFMQISQKGVIFQNDSYLTFCLMGKKNPG